MSEEQRNQPREEPESVESARAAREEMSAAQERAKAPTARGATDADNVTDATGETDRADQTGETRRTGAGRGSGRRATASRDVVGEGSPRYGLTPDEIPPHGSELSWSAQPHPGYVADPSSGYTNRRLAAGTLIGCLILALGVFYGVHILTGRSSNGFGPAPWTAAVHQDGAVVGGINTQNGGVAPPVNLPPHQSFGNSGK
jgi:hypothetical protein